MATSIANKDARCIALAGPTASGKTAAALAIASRIPVEIISVDSALVYREMDIGTAKPTVQERALVPHHLIDIRDPLDAYSAAEFVEDATRLMDEISSRGKTPLLTGGTMLYFKALFDGLDAMPKADPEVREEIEQQASERGWPQMHYELSLVDPVTAERLNPTDSQRIQRALEVFRVSGRPLSSFHTGDSRPVTDAAKRTTLISLEPATRKWLHDRIEVRFDTMLEAGLVQEVEKLRARGDLTIDHPSMRCVGYRQTWEVLDGTVPMKELRNRGIFATRQLAKRQLTWLRSMPNRQVIACDDDDALDQVVNTAIKATGQKKS